MIRLFSISRFERFPGESYAYFRDQGQRLVRLNVNTPHQTAIYLHYLAGGEVDPDIEPMLVASVIGLHDIEMYVEGPFALSHDGDAIWLFCIDGDDPSIEVTDAESYTQRWDRMPRNPEQERLQHMLLANQERRMAAAFAEIERDRQALAAERKALDQREGASSPNSEEPERPDGPGDAPPQPEAPPSGTVGGESGQ